MDKKLISQINRQQRDIEAYTDSLRLCNKELNRKLRLLITNLDEQTWLAFRNKEARLKASYERSTVIISGLIVFSIILLVVFYLVIQRDIKKDNRTLHEEVALLLNPRLVEVEHDGVCTLISIGNVTHEIRVNRIAAMTSARIIKVDDIEQGLDLISILMVLHVVVGNRRKVGKLEM